VGSSPAKRVNFSKVSKSIGKSDFGQTGVGKAVTGITGAIGKGQDFIDNTKKNISTKISNVIGSKEESTDKDPNATSMEEINIPGAGEEPHYLAGGGFSTVETPELPTTPIVKKSPAKFDMSQVSSMMGSGGGGGKGFVSAWAEESDNPWADEQDEEVEEAADEIKDANQARERDESSFKLKSGNTPPFKMMGSSPLKQHGTYDEVKKGTKAGLVVSDTQSLASEARSKESEIKAKIKEIEGHSKNNDEE